MRKQIRPSLAMAFLVPAMIVSTLAAAASPLKRQEPKTQQELVREVRHQLVMLPYYSVFDNLSYRVEGDKVILEGRVVRPTLKSDAEAAVKSIGGSVSSVVTILRFFLCPRWTINCGAQFIEPFTGRAVFRGMPSPRCRRFTSS